MATDVKITVPVNTDDGKKIVPIDAKVSDGTIDHDGTEYHLVQHSGAGFRYLADSKTVDSLGNSDLDNAMDDLATEEGL